MVDIPTVCGYIIYFENYLYGYRYKDVQGRNGTGVVGEMFMFFFSSVIEFVILRLQVSKHCMF